MGVLRGFKTFKTEDLFAIVQQLRVSIESYQGLIVRLFPVNAGNCFYDNISCSTSKCKTITISPQNCVYIHDSLL
jgi:hypothetical protein